MVQSADKCGYKPRGVGGDKSVFPGAAENLELLPHEVWNVKVEGCAVPAFR